MNLPNRLSLFRIYMVPVFLGLLLLSETKLVEKQPEFWQGVVRLVALALVIVVAITDWLDGKIARERRLITNLGKLIDPLADKVFVTAALVIFAEMRLIPAWAVIIVIAREFLITGLRSLAADAGRVIAADRLGKHKMGWQLALIICVLVALAARDFLRSAGKWDNLRENYHGMALFSGLIWIPLIVTVVLTVISGWSYIYANRDLFKGQI
ncbi:CDP-diacylglycerol--glycerol-3-phosphate 3-phosphatidyltransferase [soil metagenome]